MMSRVQNVFNKPVPEQIGEQVQFCPFKWACGPTSCYIVGNWNISIGNVLKGKILGFKNHLFDMVAWQTSGYQIPRFLLRILG